jgi:hypothetical protein
MKKAYSSGGILLSIVQPFFILLFVISYSVHGYGQQKNGFLSVTSEPNEAEVLIDSRFVGRTPIELVEIPADKYAMEIKAQNYENKMVNISIKPGQVTKHHIVLESGRSIKIKKNEFSKATIAVGVLTIITKPAGAELVIDDQPISDRTPLTIEEISAGYHSIVFNIPMGYPLNKTMTYVQDVQIIPDETSVLKIDFQQKFKTGELIVTSNLPHWEGVITFNETNEMISIGYNKPKAHLIQGKYTLEYKELGDFKYFQFIVKPGVVNRLYLPLKKFLLEEKPFISADSISRETYFERNYQPKSETQVVRQWSPNLGYFLMGIGGTALGVSMLGAKTKPEDPAQDEILGKIMGLLMTAGSAYITIDAITNQDTLTVADPKSIQYNERQKKAILDQYRKDIEIMSRKAMNANREIQEENHKIRKSNSQTEENNERIGEPSITYE